MRGRQVGIVEQSQKDGWDKAFEELTFTDDYIFKLVMERPEIFKAVLALILPTIEVEKLVSLETEKPFTVDYFFHGVRFDILVTGLEKLIDMEIQVLDTGEIPQRAMYYLSLLVARSLKNDFALRSLAKLQDVGRKLCGVLLQVRPVQARFARIQL